MAISLTINGVSYSYPEDGDAAGWGIEATNWATAVTNSMLQKTGGNFTLTADTNFGANFGLLSTHFTSTTANAAATGAIRLAVADDISFRNNANSADIAISVAADDHITFNGVELIDGTATQTLTNKTYDLGATVGSVLFTDSTGSIAQDNANLFWDNTNNKLGIGTTTPTHELHVEGQQQIVHSATATAENALDLVHNGGGKAAAAQRLTIDTGVLTAGTTQAGMHISVDDTSATGGEFHGVLVEGLAGGVEKHGLKVGTDINPILQESGAPSNPTLGTNNTASTNVPNMIDGSTGTTTSIMVADNDYIIVGADTQFSGIDIILSTVASGGGTASTFWYSTVGTDVFTEFFPVDGTAGFKNSGSIAFTPADLTGWVADGVTGKFDIKIIRTKNSLSTTPILDYMKVEVAIEYTWDKDANLCVATLRTGKTAADTLLLQAYDVNGTSFTTFATLTSNNTPTMDLADAVTHNGSTIVDAADIGVTVQAQNANILTLKNNINASVAPVATDDSGSGYAVGSRWWDTTNDVEYVLLDSTTGSAVWQSTTLSASGTWAVSDGVNTENVSPGETLTLNGTSNEIEVAVSATRQVTIGLPTNVTVAGTLDVQGAFTSLGIDDNATSTAITIDSSENVGIGTISPKARVHVKPAAGLTTLGAMSSSLLIAEQGGVGAVGDLSQIGLGWAGALYQPVAIGSISVSGSGNTMADFIIATRGVTTDTAPTERLRINSSGDAAFAENVGLGDNKKLQFGTGGVFALSTNGITSMIDHTGSDELYIRCLTNSKRILLQTLDSGGTLRSGIFVGGSTPNVQLYGAGSLSMQTKASSTYRTINFPAIPTSATGLSAGDVWSNSGVLTIV